MKKKIITDPNGSYTGRPRDREEIPVRQQSFAFQPSRLRIQRLPRRMNTVMLKRTHSSRERMK